jgi:hypothetical protein
MLKMKNTEDWFFIMVIIFVALFYHQATHNLWPRKSIGLALGPNLTS